MQTSSTSPVAEHGSGLKWMKKTLNTKLLRATTKKEVEEVDLEYKEKGEEGQARSSNNRREYNDRKNTK